MKILLADSNKENKDRLKDIISGLNSAFSNELHVLKDVNDGQKALEEVLSGEFDLLICDLRLPNLSGVHILQEIKKSGGRCRVILYGALEDMENLTLGQSEGAVGYMFRPVRKADVERLLKKAASIFELHRQSNREKDSFEDLNSKELGKEQIQQFVDWIISDGEKTTKKSLMVLPDKIASFAISIYQIEETDTKVPKSDIIDRIEEIKSSKRGLTFVDHRDCFISLSTEIGNRMDYLRECEKIRVELKLLLGLHITCGIGEIFESANGVSASMKGAAYALEYAKLNGGNNTIPIWFLENRETPNKYWCKKSEEELILYVLAGNKKEADAMVSVMKDYAARGNIGYKQLPKIFLSMMLNISRQGEEHGLSYENVFMEAFSSKKLSSFDNLEDSFEYLRQGIQAIGDSSGKQLDERREAMAEAIARQIRELAGKGITIELMSEKFNILPDNIEKLVAEFYQLNVKDLIIKEKMELGKKLLLERDLDENAIALKLGLDSRKFQELFYRHFGLSTYDYKRFEQK